jgi:hypothetical protein
LIQRTAETLIQVLQDRLTSIVLVGSAMDATREDRARHPEIIAVVRSMELSDIARTATSVRAQLRDGARIRLLTKEEIDRSADVFTVEAAEWKSHRAVLFGSDPFQDLRWTRDDMRRSLEHHLRVLDRRVRRRVFSGLALDPRETQRAIADGFHALVIAARHALDLMGRPVPSSETELLDALAESCGCQAAPLHSVLDQIHHGKHFDPIAGLGALHAIICAALEAIDRLEPHA